MQEESAVGTGLGLQGHVDISDFGCTLPMPIPNPPPIVRLLPITPRALDDQCRDRCRRCVLVGPSTRGLTHEEEDENDENENENQCEGSEAARGEQRQSYSNARARLNPKDSPLQLREHDF